LRIAYAIGAKKLGDQGAGHERLGGQAIRGQPEAIGETPVKYATSINNTAPGSLHETTASQQIHSVMVDNFL